MSFGGGGGFGGFGQNNNTQSSGFGGGGFGSTANNTTSFGGGTTGGFGSNTANTNTGGGMFGSNTTANNASGGFGASTGGFGSNTGGAFGANKTGGFGSPSTGGGMFGSTNTTQNSTSGFGGFGGSTSNAASSPFGGGGNTTSASGGLFGGNTTTASKPGFGATGTTGNSLFGAGGSSNTGGFGSGGFGASNNPGIGAAGAGDPPGTAVAQFQAYTEKEPNSSATNSFQNISFQDPYKKWSPEELRLADYTQGRRHGNASGAGAFGVSSGFGGGFGSNTQQTNTGGFGSTANTTTPATGGGLFGSTANNTTNTNTGTGFGGFGANTTTNTANTGSGLFGGANKPSGGLFGGATSQPQQSGGLFGSGNAAGNTSGGFGSTANAGTGGFGQSSSNTGGSLFGNTQNQQKPAGTGFSFGNTANNTSTSGFGAQSGGTAFGGNAAQTGTNTTTNTGGLFGGNNQQQQQNTGTGFGSSFGQQNQNQTQQSGGLFGGAQQKPAGGSLFGGTGTANNTSGGLFGNTNNQQQPQQQQQSGGLFGSTNNAQTGTSGGGLFGSKPSTGGGLFGNTGGQTNTGGGMFGGANQNQQQSTGGLFGNTNNNQQQQKPGMFGTSTSQTGGSLFGGQNNQGSTGGLFGGSTNQQQTQNAGLGSSLLGGQQQGNQGQSLTASLSDVSAYGSASLFAGVGGSETPNPGPLATPLNNGSKPRRSSILPMYKLAPASASRYATPQKRGFGFSHSTYGTPGGSPASSIGSTPGTMGRSLLGSSTSGSLSKSVSVNNLRRSFNTEDSILAPGAFSASSTRWYGSTGSKKLVINRDLRSDLFSTPQKDKQSAEANSSSRKLSKRVSFDTSNVENGDGTPVRGALPAPEDVNSSPADETTPRQNRPSASQTDGSADIHVRGNELARVNEDDDSAALNSSGSTSKDPGDYWLQPSLDELHSMNRVQRQTVANLTVGRDNIGQIAFNYPVDVSGIDLDDLCGKIIQLEPRTATVYPDSHSKPPVGKGLNVPATISLEHSWPRNARERNSKRIEKHIERLARIKDTTFVSYDKETGVWTFEVQHFTTYGLDDSDEDSDTELETPAQAEQDPNFSESQQMALDVSDGSLLEDDTFDFRQRRGVPGAFDQQAAAYIEEEVTEPQSFLGVSSADSAPSNVRLSVEQEMPGDADEEYDMSEDEEMARSSPGQHLAAEHDDTSSEGDQESKRGTPGGILRARMRAMKDSMGPVELEVAEGDDWMEMLRKTVSPAKRDRQYLREMNESPTKRTGLLIDFDKNEGDNARALAWKKSAARMDGYAASTQMKMDNGRGFATSIDLMNSLFEKPKPQPQSLRASASSKGFPKWPYERQDKTVAIDEGELAFHSSSRPSWGPNETLVLTQSLSSAQGRRTMRDVQGLLAYQKSSIQTGKQDLRLARFATETSKKLLRAQDQLTQIHVEDNVPTARLQARSLIDVFHHENMNDPASLYEKRVWELASILFDPIDSNQSGKTSRSTRRTKLSQFWADLVDQASSTAIGLAGSTEDKAVACLAGHRVAEACKNLMDGKNFHLGTLVALIGTSDASKKDMREQVKAWHDSKMLSEFSEPIRAMYEMLGGNVCVCEGLKGVPVQDRLESFVISKRFGLDWKQAFGLRLWYAISSKDDLAAAVRQFKDDISQDREDAPRPWYIEQGIPPLWEDRAANTRQDLLWGLLQLYAEETTDLEAVLRPENSQLSPLDMRLSWQLGQALAATGKTSLGEKQQEKADAATISYAAQLSSAGEWLEAIFVLLHLSDSTARTKAIQDHLCRHAGLIGSEISAEFGVLTEKFLIPAAWVWEALAVYMRSVKKDASAEVNCLLRAGSLVEAHRVLVQQVAPETIVERDYAKLASLVAQFDGQQELVPQWPLGGEVYGHFLSLVQNKSRGEPTPPAVLERLLAGLHAMNENASETDITQYAAVSDMADETAKEILRMARKQQDAEMRTKILSLPLTQDRLLAYSVDLGLDQYREIMSH